MGPNNKIVTRDGARILYDNDGHQCIAFTHLVEGHGIQANQFLLIDQNRAALIDPGGDLTYTPLSIELSKRVSIAELDYIFASHQDPDIIASLPRWMMHSKCDVVTSKLWSRFLPHLASTFVTQKFGEDLDKRIISIPDNGMSISFGRSVIQAVPAHFLHSVGNFQFYDPVSKILFTGDVGASLMDDNADLPVTDFHQHIQHMKGFHQRYMASNKACRIWVNRARQLDIEMLVPQHGSPFVGREMVHRFFDWISELRCGTDLMDDHGFSGI